MMAAGAVLQTVLVLTSATLVDVVWAQVAAMAITLGAVVVAGSGQRSPSTPT